MSMARDFQQLIDTRVEADAIRYACTVQLQRVADTQIQLIKRVLTSMGLSRNPILHPYFSYDNIQVGVYTAPVSTPAVAYMELRTVVDGFFRQTARIKLCSQVAQGQHDHYEQYIRQKFSPLLSGKPDTFREGDFTYLMD